MTTFRTIATLIMSTAFGFFGLAKITGASIVTEADSWNRLGSTQWTLIGVLELCAVAGLLLALVPRFRRIGIAAATGLVALTACAFVFHLANGDAAGDWLPAVIQGTIAATYAVVTRRQIATSETGGEANGTAVPLATI